MLIEESQKRQEQLKECLLEMAASSMEEPDIRRMVIKLKSIYSGGFRHSYADSFSLIIGISKEEEKYSLEYLSTNLDNMRALVEQDYVSGEKEFSGIYPDLSRLSDHINLEIGRYNYYALNDQKLDDLEQRNKKLLTELREATQKLEKAQDTVSSMQTELIAVLSIFAAIVLTFSGSMGFVGNTLSGMAEAPLFKAIFFVLLCGVVVFNLIFLMMYIVGKITGRNIYARCKSDNCTCGENKMPACKGITRLRKRLPYVFWMNVVLLILMIADAVAWYFNMVEWHLPL